MRSAQFSSQNGAKLSFINVEMFLIFPDFLQEINSKVYSHRMSFIDCHEYESTDIDLQ